MIFSVLFLLAGVGAYFLFLRSASGRRHASA
jgi:hypothetical protein